jgi:hypothetical protein
MATLALTFAVFFLAALAMAVGVLVTGRRLRGSCGGPSCDCAANGQDVLDCGVGAGESALPMHPGQDH